MASSVSGALSPAKVSRCRRAPTALAPRGDLPPEDLPQGFYGQEKAPPTRAPLRAVQTQPPAGDHTVDMDMLGQGLAPGMENCRNAEFGAQMFGVLGKFSQGLGGGVKQQVVEGALVDPNEGIEPMGQGEDDVEVGHRQQQGLLGGQPLGLSTTLTLGTVAIATGVVTDPFRPAAQTLFDLAAQGSRPTLRNRPQDARLLVRDGVRRPKRCAIARTMSATSKGGGDGWTSYAAGAVGDDSGGMGSPAAPTSGKLSSGDPWAVR